MGAFVIEGGRQMKGTIVPQGAKNEALQVISAALLTDQEVRISNVPDILDVKNLIRLMMDLGLKVTKESEDTYCFQADDVNLDFAYSEEFLIKCRKLRGSILLLGPLLSRYGKAVITKPGGDKIGRRRLDTHFQGFQSLGATFDYDEETELFSMQAKDGLHGKYMLLEEASVTGTANVIMAAVLAEGTTTIYNAACEPYVQQLCRLLIAMGAKIEGVASNRLTIEGVDHLSGADHTILPDMIEVGSFIGMAAMTASEITIVNPHIKEMAMIPRAFQQLGIRTEMRGEDLFIPAQEHYEIDTFMDGSILTIADAPWPGLSPDLISVMLVAATQARGSVLFHQKMFESRLFFVDKLIDIGAQIILCDPHRAAVIGLDRSHPFRAATMDSPDIRAGIALLIAAMSASGTSRINNIEQIDRGYQNIDKRLNAIGASISRID